MLTQIIWKWKGRRFRRVSPASDGKWRWYPVVWAICLSRQLVGGEWTVFTSAVPWAIRWVMLFLSAWFLLWKIPNAKASCWQMVSMRISIYIVFWKERWKAGNLIYSSRNTRKLPFAFRLSMRFVWLWWWFWLLCFYVKILDNLRSVSFVLYLYFVKNNLSAIVLNIRNREYREILPLPIVVFPDLRQKGMNLLLA